MKSFAKISFSLLSFIMYSHFSFSQESNLGNWFMYFGNQKINKKWNWHNEIQYRNFNVIGDLEQLLIRTGVGYDLSENNNNILLGYAFVHSQPYIKDSDEKLKTNEHRIFQQLITKQTFGRFNLQHRYRIEERFIEDNFRMRFRYLVSLNVPINQKSMQKKALYISANNEIFINSQKDYFDRNRIYGAIGYCINNFIRVEAGAMRQLLSSNSRTQLQIAFYNNLAFD